MQNTNKDQAMNAIINDVRNCSLNCYTDEYTGPLRTTGNRTIEVKELKNGKPLIDDWRGQLVLFISQAPSKQAWADHKLSSLDNAFYRDLLLPKVYPNILLKEALDKWMQLVFWVHSANCYPYIFTQGKNKGRDKPPNLICANKYLDRIINTMKPGFIILMGYSATKFFASSIRTLIDTQQAYPSLEMITKWQYNNKKYLSIKTKTGIDEYTAIAIPHAANWGDLQPVSKNAYEMMFSFLQKMY